MSGLELCPKCKKGHMYPVVTASVSAEPKGIRDYECAICGHKQTGAKETHYVNLKDKVSAREITAKKSKAKTKAKTKPKAKKTKSRKRK